MIGRTYTLDITNTSLSDVSDIMEAAPADDKPIILSELYLSQKEDITSNQLIRIGLYRGATTGGSGGNAVTPSKRLPGDAAASFTGRSFATTDASGGTPELLTVWRLGFAFPIIRYYPDVLTEVCTHAQNRFVLKPLEAPTAAIEISGYAKFIEIG